MLDRVLHPNTSHGHPLRRHRHLGGVEPETLLGQVEARLFHQREEKLEVVERPRRDALVVAAANVEDEAAVVG